MSALFAITRLADARRLIQNRHTMSLPLPDRRHIMAIDQSKDQSQSSQGQRNQQSQKQQQNQQEQRINPHTTQTGSQQSGNQSGSQSGGMRDSQRSDNLERDGASSQDQSNKRS